MKVLDINAKQDVAYCIPDWLRDEQIKVNLINVEGRLRPSENRELRSEPIALVNFGPSLVDTWEEVRQFKYIMSCSGSHKFLVDRGIIPTWHVDVDPRPHKITLMGQPQKETEYLIANTCHPLLFKHLEGYNVKLWHILDASEEGWRTLPPDEWAITGGCSVGVRLLTIARFLGFTDLHIFGMDGNARETGKHAADHPNKGKPDAVVEYDGVTYITTPAMLEAARNTEHELNQLTDVKYKFYGEGLVQHMMRNFTRKDFGAGKPAIAFSKPELISAPYIEQNRQLHSMNLAYGVGGGKYALVVMQLVEKIQPELKRIPSILDYGCGKGYLAKALPFPIWEYDPAIPGKDASPKAADIVVCTDVLEHIEPDKIHFVLGDLARCVKEIGYFVIHTGPSTKTLPDGRNTHLLQHDREWWKKKLKRYFSIGLLQLNGVLLFAVVSPLRKENAPAKAVKHLHRV
jgi:Uncharacterized protein conserved in bacteria